MKSVVFVKRVKSPIYIFFYLTKSDYATTSYNVNNFFFFHICSVRNFDSIIMWDTDVYTAFDLA